MVDLARKTPLLNYPEPDKRADDFGFASVLPISVKTAQFPQPQPLNVDTVHPVVVELQSMGKAKFLNRIAVRQDDKLVLVHLREVFWVQSKGNLLSLHLRDADYDCRMTMKDLLAMLDPGCFLRIHRNAIVNLDYVVEFDLPRNGNAFVVLRNGKALPISKSGKTELKRSLSPRSFFQPEATEAV